MNKQSCFLLAGLILLLNSPALAGTTILTRDAQDNEILSTVDGSDRGLNVHVTNASSIGGGGGSGGTVTQGPAGSEAWLVDGSGVVQPISASSLPLPVGAAQDRTAANAPSACRLTDGASFYKPTTPTDTQPISGSVAVTNFPGSYPVTGSFWQSTQPVSIASMPTTPVTGTFWQSTQPVSASALPLPTGASTSVLQTTGNTSLASVDSHVIKADTDHTIISALTKVTSANNSTTTPLPAVTDFVGTSDDVEAYSTIKITIHSDGNTASNRLYEYWSGDNVNWWDPTGGIGVDVSDLSVFYLAPRAKYFKLTYSNRAAPQTFLTLKTYFFVLPQPTSDVATETSLLGVFSELFDVKVATESVDSKFPSPVSGRIPVDGSGVTQPVSIASMPSTPVTGTFWQATQPVSGPLTDTQLRATAVPVSGTFWQSTQPVSGTVSANASQTGTWTVQPGNTQNTTPWLVTQPDITQAVNITSPTGTQAISLNGDSAVGVVITSIGTGGSYNFEGSVDGTNYTPVYLYNVGLPSQLGRVSSSIILTGQWVGNLSGLKAFRIRAIALTSGAITGSITAGRGHGGVISVDTGAKIYSNADTPSGVEAYSMVGISPVANIVYSAIQNLAGDTFVGVKAASTAAAATDPALVVAISPNNSVAVTGTFWPATQPISAASLPLPTGAATDSSITNVQQTVAAGTRATKSGLIGVTYNSALPTLTDGQGAAAQANSKGELIVSQPTAADLNATVTGTVTANATLAAETTKVIGTVNIAASQTVGLAAGSAVVGHVINDASSAVIGHVINDASSAVIGHVIVDTAPSTAVTNTGTFATQSTLAAETTKVIGTVNVAASQTIGLAAGSQVIGHVVVDTAPSTAVTNAGTFAVQAAESGTWTVQPGNTANTTAWLMSINDGTNTAKVQAASTTPAAADKALTVVYSPNGGNPCNNPSATLVSITGATSTTNATQIIALSGTTKIYICSMTIIGVSGTSPTFSLVQGTGSNCVTGQTNVVQAWATTAGTLYAFANPVAVGVAGNELCYKDGGTTPVQNYQINYVQQ